MFVKIYFGDKPLFLCNEITPEIAPFAHHDDAILIDELSANAIRSMIHEMKLEKIHAGIIVHPDLEALKKAFFKKFDLIQAAGGMVFNGQKEVLFIFRRGKWDLPKGKLDEGESLEQCAIREVEEETGLRNITLNEFMITTWHTYDEYGQHILKESHWYRMQVPDGQLLVPQTEEQITGIRWVKREGWDELMQNTFPSIKDVLETAK